MVDTGSPLARTLATYEAELEAYVSGTRSEVSGSYKAFLDTLLATVKPDATILEVGSGTGRDADYMEARGYRVVRTDVVDSFLRYQRERGRTIRRFDILTGELAQRFDLVAALAVFHHFQAGQWALGLSNVRRHLKPDGRFALSVKLGDGEAFSTHKLGRARYFRYSRPDSLAAELHASGFEVESMQVVDDQWLQSIARLQLQAMSSPGPGEF